MLPIGRLLPAILCLCSMPALAQDHQNKLSVPGTIPTTQMPDFRTTPPPTEPWRIIPKTPGDQPMNALIVPDHDAVLTPGGIPTDEFCLAIRSYVVARDSKDSDSVHPAGYTTCVPASRYRLRKTVMQQESTGK